MRSAARDFGVVSGRVAMAALALADRRAGAPTPPSASRSGKRAPAQSDVPHCTYASTASQFFTQAAGHPPVGLTDFVFNTTGGAPDDRRRQGRPGRPARGAQRQPAGGPAVPESDTSKRMPLACAASEVGTSDVTSEIAGICRSGRCRSRSTTSSADNGVPGPLRLHGRTPQSDPDRECLPRSPIRLGRRLPRGLHDQRHPERVRRWSRTASSSTARSRQRHLPDDGKPVQRRPPRPASRSTPTRSPGQFQSPQLRRRSRRPDRSDGCASVPFKPAIAAAAESAPPIRRAGPVDLNVPLHAAPQPPELLDGEDGEGDPAARSRPQPGGRAEGCRSAPTPSSARAPKRRSPARPPRRSAPSRSRRRCCRPARCRATSSSASRRAATRLGQRVPDLRRRRVGPLRALGPPARQRQRQPATGQLTATFAERPQVAFSSVQAAAQRRPEGAADQPADLRPEHDHARDARPGPATPHAAPPNGFKLTNAPGGGACAKTDGRTALLARLQRRSRTHRSRRLHALPAEHHPQRRPAGAQRLRHHPAAGSDREARGRPLLPARGDRRGRGAAPAPQRRKARAARTRARSASPRSQPAPAPRR